jgi:hypothetical protein
MNQRNGRFRILICTDSLGVPRMSEYDLVDTYPYRISRKYESVCDVIYFSELGLTAKKLHNKAVNYLKDYRPDMVVAHIGIVDCTPRMLRQIELFLLEKIPCGGVIINLLRKYRSKIVKFRKISYLSAPEFEHCIRSFNDEMSARYNVAIGIAAKLPAYDHISPGSSSNIAQFNAILGRYMNLIEPYNGYSNVFLADSHHINKAGHGLVFNQLCGVIDDILKNEGVLL